ncbi:hypothetical protein QFW80_16820 [Luteimonas sp. M1R5S18]|uniref:Secreted protein n=1 Tax=Luteimonas rhizosphaericola TaxID=3042024 RepID=A0ABT6JNY9_9GAMM|nr:hypothetical protein [Luteimonas rhizosphaericola]MDH5832183.1 hypothetical protein [Luteimonas rhizosphaericola]
MKKTTTVMWLTIAVSGVALACAVVPSVVAPLVTVSPSDSFSDKWDKIAQKLHQTYGNQLRDSEVISVRVPVKTCIGPVCGASIDTQFLKACGQTFKQAAEAIGDTYANGGGPGGIPPQYDPTPPGGWAGCFPGTGEIIGCSSAGGGEELCTSEPVPILVCPGMG